MRHCAAFLLLALAAARPADAQTGPVAKIDEFVRAEMARQKIPGVKLIDVRSREEYEAVHIDGALLLSQPVMQEIMGKWARSETLVVIDHQGKSALDAAAYFLGHGFENVRCLRGGIDGWSQEVDTKLPRYRLGA